MTKARAALVVGWSMLAALLVAVVSSPSPVLAQASCNGQMNIEYVAGPSPANVGDTIRVRLTLFAGPIGAGTQLEVNRVRMSLDCDADFALGLPCTNDGLVVSYEGNITQSGLCLAEDESSVTFSTVTADGSTVPNEIVFDADTTLVIPADTASADGCVLEFDVQVQSVSNDSSTYFIEQVAGYRTVMMVRDAECDNGLVSNVNQSAAIALAPPTPSPTSTPSSTPTSTPTSTPSTTNTPTSTPSTTNTPTSTATRTPTNTPTSTSTNTPTITPTSSIPTATPSPVCDPIQFDNRMIPGYCSSSDTRDCEQEICTSVLPPLNGSGLPQALVTCDNDDPLCDATLGDDTCTFSLSLCYNVQDSRMPCVQSNSIGRINIRRPNQRSGGTPVDKLNRDALVGAFLAQGATVQGTCRNYPFFGQPCTLNSQCDSLIPGLGVCRVSSIVFNPPLTTPTCLPGVQFRVPLRPNGLAGRKSLRIRAYPSTGAAHDGDILDFVCRP